MVTTTEEWVSNYLKRLVFFAESEALNSGFDVTLGGKLVSFCLYCSYNSVSDDIFQSELLKILELHTKSLAGMEKFYSLYSFILKNCLNFGYYVENTQANEYVKTHCFLRAWRRNDGGNVVAL
jgi:hypothetical protein